MCMGGGVDVGLSLCGLGRAARLVLTFLLRCAPGVAPGAPHERLADGKRGLGHATADLPRWFGSHDLMVLQQNK